MARGPATFKQGDVTKAVKAVVAAGILVFRVKIGKDGSIEIDTCKVQSGNSGETTNPWDTIE
jgi:hypothetical protein